MADEKHTKPKIIVSGKRKTAVAKAEIKEGTGKVLINNKSYDQFQVFDRLKLEEPLRIAKEILGKLNFDIGVSVRGGGEKGQVDAIRVAISNAIVKFTGSTKLEDAYFDYDRNMIVADVRRKEAYKPGDSKARSKRQSSKR